MWATALSEIGDLKSAIKIYKIAQKYDPRDTDTYLNWGISLAKAGRKSKYFLSAFLYSVIYNFPVFFRYSVSYILYCV